MVNFYVKRIENGIMTLEEVPELWRTKVETKICELNAKKKRE